MIVQAFAVASLVAAAALPALAAPTPEIMLLTPWGGALERYGQNTFTTGVHYNTKDPTSAMQKWIVDLGANTIRSPDGYCLAADDRVDSGFVDDLMVITSKCNGGAKQRWVFSSVDQTFQITLTNFQGTRTYCLDADKNAPSKTIHGWSCSPSNAPNVNQQWTFFYPGYQIKVGDKCLALAQSNKEDEPIRLATCANDALQMWKYDFATGRFKLGDPASNMCLDSWPVGESGGVHMWTCDATNENQQIDFVNKPNVNGDFQGYFFVRDTENFLTVSADGSKLVMTTPFTEGVTTLFTLKTDPPGDLCNGKTCQNGGVCLYSRCRCLDGTQGDSCETVGKRVRIRASNGMFLTVNKTTNYSLSYELLDSSKSQQVWYHFPGTDVLKIARRRMCLQADGDAVELTTCRPAEANQKWVYDVSTGRFQLKNTKRCLDIDARGVSTGVRVQDCVAATSANQVWEEISPDGLPVNSDMLAALIRHRTTPSLCWTLANSQVITAACQSSASQLWSFNDAYTGVGSLCNGDSCAVAKSGDAKALVTLASYDGQRLDQRFEYESLTGQIRMANTDQCIAKTSDSSNHLAMTKCSATDPAQMWYIAKMDKCLSTGFANVKKCVMGTCAFGRCQCQPGFQGADCASDSCSLLQCNNGGTCALGKCTCADGYEGMFCDTFVKCKGVKCVNGAKCGRDGKCDCPVGFSGERCQTKHPKVLLRALEFQAIGLEGGLVTTVIPDTRKKEHQWIWDAAKSMFRSLASATMCLEQLSEADLGTAVCNTTKPEQKWNYNAAAGRLFAGKDGKSTMIGLEESVAGRFRPRLGTAFPSTNGLDLGFIEVDRLDLPGTSIRSSDRSTCLSLSATNALSTTPCSSDDEAQQWEYHPQNGVLKLPRIGSPVCLSVSGASVAAAKCNGDDSAQQFAFDFTTKRFKNRKTSACLVMATNGLSTAECASDAPATQIMRVPFRGFCDVINMCEGNGVCAFGRCSCAAGRSGGFCEVVVDAQ